MSSSRQCRMKFENVWSTRWDTSLHTSLPSVASLTMNTESGQLKELTLPPQTTICQCSNVSDDVATTSSWQCQKELAGSTSLCPYTVVTSIMPMFVIVMAVILRMTRTSFEPRRCYLLKYVQLWIMSVSMPRTFMVMAASNRSWWGEHGDSVSCTVTKSLVWIGMYLMMCCLLFGLWTNRMHLWGWFSGVSV